MTRVFDKTLQWNVGFTRVCVGSGILGEVGQLVRETDAFTGAVVITDENVETRYGTPVQTALNQAGIATELAVVPAGDSSKTLEQASRLYDRLGALRIDRGGLVVAVGGGMVTDLAGFVAGTWHRGIASVLCPTTLEADVDAAIGGKTAVNHQGGKNLIGVVHHPRLVIADTHCLTTLPQRDLVAGLAESIKHAVISGEGFMAWHEANASGVLGREHDVLVLLIEKNIRIKAELVARDEHDTGGIRALLNFGHTLGHALEAAGLYRFRHGECVSVGMVGACHISRSLGLLAKDDCKRIVDLLGRYGLPTRFAEGINPADVWGWLLHDKKIRAGALRFVLLEGLGQPVLRTNVPEAVVREAIGAIAGTG